MALISRAETEKAINGLKINVRFPSITHLFFVDDSLLFFKAERGEALRIKEILQQYEVALGQAINFHKSALTVSPATSSEQVGVLKTIFDMEVVTCHSQYLGLPSTISKNKKDVFVGIRERVMK